MTLLAQMQRALSFQKEELEKPENVDITTFISGRVKELEYWIEIINTHENIQIS